MSCESVHSDNKDSATAPKLRRHATRHQPATTPSKKLCLMSLLKVATKTSSAHTHYLYQLLRLRRHGLIDPPVNKQPNKQSLMKTQPEAHLAGFATSTSSKNSGVTLLQFLFSSTNKIHLQQAPAVQLGNTTNTNPFCLPSLAGLTLLLLAGCNKVLVTHVCVQV